MIQEIITYSVVALAAGILFWNLIKIIFPPKNQHTNSTGCSSSCNCDSKAIKSTLLESKKNN